MSFKENSPLVSYSPFLQNKKEISKNNKKYQFKISVVKWKFIKQINIIYLLRTKGAYGGTEKRVDFS